MRTQLISDTHGKHRDIIISPDVNLLVHSGDSTNYYDLYKNEIEFKDFINWFAARPVKHKVLIAGNHDAWATKKYNIDMCKDLNVTYLQDDYTEIDGKIIFGSPWSPQFGNWHFMKNRGKLGIHWDKVLISEIDLLVTHSPPYGVLDTVIRYSNNAEIVGCKGLRKAVEKYKPKNHVFGHIHDNQDIVNHGIRIIGDTKFINASSVKDGEFSKPAKNNKGIIINL